MDIQPVNQVLIEINEALQSEITTDSGLRLFYDPSYKKEWAVSVVGNVIALPIKMNSKQKKIAEQLSVGDEIFFSYRVVADFDWESDGERFMPSTEDNPYVKEFVNGAGEKISMYALPKRSGLIGATWVAMYLGKGGNFISGEQGSEEEVERWMAQFPFGKTDIYKFNNMFEYRGKTYWKASIEDIFAKKVDGHLVAVGDRVICRPIEEDVPENVKSSLGYMGDVKIRYQDRGKILTGGKEKGLKKEQTISFSPTHNEKYEFYGKQYFLINQNFVQGVWQSQPINALKHS